MYIHVYKPSAIHHRSELQVFLNCFCLQMSVCMSVSMFPSQALLTSGMTWIQYNWLNKLWKSYTAVVVGIISGCGLSIGVPHKTSLQ